MPLPDLIHALKQVHVEDLLLPLLVQLVVILLAARLFGRLFHGLRQPAVVGAVVGGLLLGPSFFGYYFPDASRWLFHPGLGEVPQPVADELYGLIFTTLAQLGLVLLLFLVGLEFDFGHLRDSGRSAAGVAVAGLVLPFGLGLALAPLVLGGLPAQHQPPDATAFALFLGTALAITALPVLGQMLVEMNVTRTRLATVTITAAAVEDALGWILLAAVVAATRTGFQVVPLLQMVGLTLLFAAVMLSVVRPLAKRWIAWTLARHNGELSATSLAILLALIFLFAVATSWIGIFAIFGAFLFGAILSSEEAFRKAVTARLLDFVTAFFLPVFFTYTGLRTNVGSLDTAGLWLLCGLVLAASVFGKWVGCGLAARWGGFSPREASLVGVLMNTRGLMELIVINVGRNLGVVPEPVYCMLVLMAVATTLMTTPLVLWLAPGTELEPHLRESIFARALPEKSEPGGAA